MQATHIPMYSEKTWRNLQQSWDKNKWIRVGKNGLEDKAWAEVSRRYWSVYLCLNVAYDSPRAVLVVRHPKGLERVLLKLITHASN